MRPAFSVPAIAMIGTLLITTTSKGDPPESTWETMDVTGTPTARHEAAFVGFGGKFFLMGGRRINPVDVFDPTSKTWTQNSTSPIEIHHFQGVVYGDAIFLMGAMTGKFPGETPLEKVLAYVPDKDAFEFRHTIPQGRRRGGAGAVVYHDKIYLVGGITNGHIDGSCVWFDEYDPATGQWEVMPDAPRARDHFQAAVIGDRLYAAGGRRTSGITKQYFDLTEPIVDVFDFKLGEWLPEDQCPTVPTPRAGNSCVAVDGKLIVGGGESATQVKAHNEIEVFDPKTKRWESWPWLQQGRHGSGLVVAGRSIYTASGCGNRGGSPELTSIEKLSLDSDP